MSNRLLAVNVRNNVTEYIFGGSEPLEQSTDEPEDEGDLGYVGGDELWYEDEDGDSGECAGCGGDSGECIGCGGCDEDYDDEGED